MKLCTCCSCSCCSCLQDVVKGPAEILEDMVADMQDALAEEEEEVVG